jgi:hypothetical protein
MKICVVFRGENVRHTDIVYGSDRKYINVLMLWDNLKKTIIDDLINNGHDVDIAFVTYDSHILQEIKDIINPKYTLIENKISQTINFNNVLTFISNHDTLYDRFVILRCDVKYKTYITKWPKWDEKGITIVNKDVHWHKLKLYSDMIFIVDSREVKIFIDAYFASMYGNTIHGLGGYLYNNNIPFHLMYEGYYHNDKHPLFVWVHGYDLHLDLDNPLYIEPLQDISQWQ